RVLAIGDGVENFAVGHFPDPVILQSDDGVEAVLFGDAIARCGRAVAHGAGDAETFAPALKQLRRYRNWNSSSPFVTHLSSIDVIDAKTKGARHWFSCGRHLRLRYFVTERHSSIHWHPWFAAVRRPVQRCLRAHFH